MSRVSIAVDPLSEEDNRRRDKLSEQYNSIIKSNDDNELRKVIILGLSDVWSEIRKDFGSLLRCSNHSSSFTTDLSYLLLEGLQKYLNDGPWQSIHGFLLGIKSLASCEQNDSHHTLNKHKVQIGGMCLACLEHNRPPVREIARQCLYALDLFKSDYIIYKILDKIETLLNMDPRKDVTLSTFKMEDISHIIEVLGKLSTSNNSNNSINNSNSRSGNTTISYELSAKVISEELNNDESATTAEYLSSAFECIRDAYTTNDHGDEDEDAQGETNYVVRFVQAAIYGMKHSASSVRQAAGSALIQIALPYFDQKRQSRKLNTMFSHVVTVMVMELGNSTIILDDKKDNQDFLTKFISIDFLYLESFILTMDRLVRHALVGVEARDGHLKRSQSVHLVEGWGSDSMLPWVLREVSKEFEDATHSVWLFYCVLAILIYLELVITRYIQKTAYEFEMLRATDQCLPWQIRAFLLLRPKIMNSSYDMILDGALGLTSDINIKMDINLIERMEEGFFGKFRVMFWSNICCTVQSLAESVDAHMNKGSDVFIFAEAGEGGWSELAIEHARLQQKDTMITFKNALISAGRISGGTNLIREAIRAILPSLIHRKNSLIQACEKSEVPLVIGSDNSPEQAQISQCSLQLLATIATCSHIEKEFFKNHPSLRVPENDGVGISQWLTDDNCKQSRLSVLLPLIPYWSKCDCSFAPLMLAVGIISRVSKSNIQNLYNYIFIAADKWHIDYYPGDECMVRVIKVLYNTVCSYEWNDLNIVNILKAIKILLHKINLSQRIVTMNKLDWQALLDTEILASRLCSLDQNLKVKTEPEAVNEEDDDEFSDWDESSTESISKQPIIIIPTTDEIKTLYTSLRDIEY